MSIKNTITLLEERKRYLQKLISTVNRKFNMFSREKRTLRGGSPTQPEQDPLGRACFLQLLGP